MVNKKVRVRFAPSPTGALHIGGMRTALFNYLFAKKHGGDFILRIEDTDTARTVPGAEEYIIESLKWAGIEPNEGIGYSNKSNPNDVGPHFPYKQSERNDRGIYELYVNKLINSGFAYYAFDTPEEINAIKDALKKAGVKTPFSYNSFNRDNMKNSLTMSDDLVEAKLAAGEPYVVRIKMPRNEDIKFTDLIRGAMSVKSSTIDDKVLFKSDGMPTYHMANVVDDHLMEISHVIRGEEWLPSAPLHVVLYKFLGWESEMPEFAHMPLIMGPNGKLSKRDGDSLGFPVYPMQYSDPVTFEISSGYKERGYLPSAFVNMIALLGWNPGNNLEMMTMDEMIEKFSFERVNKSGAKFDLKKAESMQKQWLKRTDNRTISKIFREILSRGVDDGPDFGVLGFTQTEQLRHSLDYFDKVCGLLKEKVNYIEDFWKNGRYFFIDPPALPFDTEHTIPHAKLHIFRLSIMDWISDPSCLEVSHDEAKAAFDDVVKSTGVDARHAGNFLRFALTGMNVGPPIFDIISLVGPNICFRRLELCKIADNSVSMHEISEDEDKRLNSSMPPM